MEYRYLGNSGLKVSTITYGNWLTHASQVENDVAIQCVRTALDAGISTFDTAHVGGCSSNRHWLRGNPSTTKNGC